jgi:hypothetical protein
MPPPPADRWALHHEMRLSPALHYEDTYMREDLWCAFLAWKHEECRTIHGTQDFLPSEVTPDSEDEVDDDYNEEDEEMEDMPPPSTMKMEALFPDNYDEEAATAVALVVSKVDEDSKWSWPRLEEVVHVFALVVEHVASRATGTAISTARATTSSVARPDGPTFVVRAAGHTGAVATATAALHVAAAGGPCLGAAGVGTPAVLRPHIRQR